MPSTGFECANPTTKWPQTYTLGRTATAIGKMTYIIVQDKTQFYAEHHRRLNITIATYNLNSTMYTVTLHTSDVLQRMA